jgi:tetratricopeptide (TPR) repeat protein
MAEPRRLDPSHTPDAAAGRSGDAETLLVEGLDHYFSGRYEEAIHIWTRVLFLDRSHARARAYIDRARTALAERHRHSEEMLQASQDLLERGQTDEARNLLTVAMAEGGDDARASALRVKLERLERAHVGAQPGRRSAITYADVVPGWSWPRRSRVVLVLGAAVTVALVVLAGLTSPAVRAGLGLDAANEALVAKNAPGALPTLSSSDVALVRARSLYGRGRLAEALQALDRVDSDSPIRAEANALRVEIQRLLLASAQERSPAAQGKGARR